MNIWKQLIKLKPEQQLLLGIALIVLLSSLFWRTGSDPFSIGASAHIGNLKGKIELEAFTGEYEGERHDDAYIYRKKHFVLFYVPWCGYCKNVLPIWDQLSQKYSDRDVKIMKVNCEKFTNMSSKHGIDSYPTIRYYPAGLTDTKNYITFVESRDLNSFIRFLEKYSSERNQYDENVETFQTASTYNAPVGYNDYEIFEPFSMDTRDYEDDEPSVDRATGVPDKWYEDNMNGARPQALVKAGPMREL